MQPILSDSSCDEEEKLLGPIPTREFRTHRVVAGMFAALVVMALCACGLYTSKAQQRSDGMSFIGLNSEDTADKYKQTIHKQIESFEHICKECRGDAKKYYGAKLDAVTALEKKCKADKESCGDTKKKIDDVMDEVNGAWDGTDCPKEMPMSCTITSKCKPFPKKACAPKTCHPINLLKSFGKNNQCTDAAMECDGHEKVSLSQKIIAEEYKQMIHKKIEGFAHICKECRGDAKKFYGAKLDAVTALEKKCKADKETCDDTKTKMDKVMDEVNGAWNGTDCPAEMPMSCTISSKCKPFPKRACAPKTCHPINLLKSFGKNNKCTDAAMECDGHEKVSLKKA